MDESSERQKEIIEIARKTGRVLVDDLASRFDVTPQTIRRDLNDLCERRLLSRIHGGAIIASGVINASYEARRFIAHTEKQIIGAAAATLIPNGASLFINIGTTTEEVARALIITNNLNVAIMTYANPNIEVIMAGGPVRRADGAIIGEAAAQFISQFKVDYAIIGASALDQDGALLDFDYREVSVAKTIIENARTVILVADRLKFERTAPVRIAHISDIDIFVTDQLPDGEFGLICQENGVKAIETQRQSEEIP
jgi:DeoR family glycerol-3-phosphate regulon repressor